MSAPEYRPIWAGEGDLREVGCGQRLGLSDVQTKVGWQKGVMDELQILHAARAARI